MMQTDGYVSKLAQQQQQQMYQSYPNPKKARLIHQAVSSGPAKGGASSISTSIPVPPCSSSTEIDASSSVANKAQQSASCFYAGMDPYIEEQQPLYNHHRSTAPSIFLSVAATGGTIPTGHEWVLPPGHNSPPPPPPFHLTISCQPPPPPPNIQDGTPVYTDLHGAKARDYLRCYDSRSGPHYSLSHQLQQYVSQHQYDHGPASAAASALNWYRIKSDERASSSSSTAAAMMAAQIGGMGSPLLSAAAAAAAVGAANGVGVDLNYREMKEKRKCDVCGDVSAGFHCSAFVCEACKKFFIRSSKGESYSKYSCTKASQCEVVKDTRTHCQYCRFQKCLRLGMTLPGSGTAAAAHNADISLIPCRVCGAQSSGFHFGAITCEGCKGFFRRTINERENQKYTCRNGGTCLINLATRNNCKSCRYKKCLTVGMSKEGSRIGRQPNAVKHMCAMEINQIRAAGGGPSQQQQHQQQYTDGGASTCYQDLHQQLHTHAQQQQQQQQQTYLPIISSMSLAEFGLSSAPASSSTTGNSGSVSSLTGSSLAASAAISSRFQLHQQQQQQLHQNQQPQGIPDQFYLSSTGHHHQSQQQQQQLVDSDASSIYGQGPSQHQYDLSLLTHHLQASAVGLDSALAYNNNIKANSILLDSYKKEMVTPGDIPKLEYYLQQQQQQQQGYYLTDSGLDAEVISRERYSDSDVGPAHTVITTSDTQQDREPMLIADSDSGVQFMSTTNARNVTSTASNSNNSCTSAVVAVVNEKTVSPPPIFISGTTKFSLDMPLHKFISVVNNAAKYLSSCRRRVTQHLQLDATANECFVWDVMMQQFYAHAYQVIKFAKAVPGFRELCHNDMKVLVQEGIYPIILVQMSRDFNTSTDEYNYFNFSNPDKQVILNKFAIFYKIAEHVCSSGRLLKPRDFDETLFSLICYIELVKGDSCSIINRAKVSQMYHYAISALRLYMTEIGCVQEEITTVLDEILPSLSRMTQEHQDAVLQLRTDKPSLKFPNLYAEMFLVD